MGVNTDQKSRVGKVCSPKKFFDFWEPVKVCNFGNFGIKNRLLLDARRSKIAQSEEIIGYVLQGSGKCRSAMAPKQDKLLESARRGG